ncbi:MAG: hypothetical protein MUF15_01900 [Acidobacteria bacterium]|jgi:hypothetical protein|nr:hypothetical protein [Acidobacteriota bacterium]
MNKNKFNMKNEWRKFGFILGIILAIIATILLFKSRAIYIYFYGTGFFFILAGLLLPIIVKPVFILFMYISEVLGWVMTRLILGILFYLIITPMSLLGKLFGKKFLDLQFPGKQESYWLEADKLLEQEGKHNYENQF